MVKIVVDSSLFIEEIRHGSEKYGELVKLCKKGVILLLVPMVVITELWSGESMDRKKDVEIVELMLTITEKVVLNEKIAKLTGELNRKYKTGVVDAMVAATALENDAIVATLNTKHFVGIKGLKLYNISK